MLDIIGGVSNALRGGQGESWLTPIQNKYSFIKPDYINALIYSMTVLFLSNNWILALAAIPAMLAGATPGWGSYIGAMLKSSATPTPLSENIVFDKFIFWAIKSPTMWGASGLFVRGLFWGLCLSIPYWLLGYNDVALDFIVRGCMMPIAYGLAGMWITYRLKTIDAGTSWGLGEVFFGIILWGALYKL